MKAALGAALLAVVAGCAPPALPSTPSTSVASAADRTNERAPRADETHVASALEAALGVAPPADDDANDAEDAPPASFSPEAIHKARIALAKEELVQENAMKERLDVAEQQQRELEDFAVRSTKSRPTRRAAPR